MITNSNPASTFTPSRWRRIFCSLFLVAAALATIGAVHSSRASRAISQGSVARPGATINKIAPEVLADTSDGKSASVIILLADQANVSAAYGMRDQDARGWFVYNTLSEHAARTQIGLRNFLDSRGVTYQSFWVVNMLVATADRALVETLAARPDVARVDSNRPTRWIEDPSIANLGVTPSAPAVVEWGVQNVNAPQVWTMGFTGQGIVVGNQDTGMRWTHNALKPHYRGWDGVNANHNYNWHDSIHSGGGVCGPNNLAPCDDSGHGTHTTGTTVGDDGAGNQVGVAPGAKWIGCRNMDQGNGTPATYSECFQFFMAPTDLNGQNPNPALRPHVMNNSWTCPVSEGCTTGDELRVILENTQATGIFVEASAGNAGPGCSSVNDPPAIYEATFSTGAIDINNTIAGFSSRGPVTRDGSNRLKPNISAPGVNNRSSYFSSDTSYANLSGTSMAGPHVVGSVALLWSARPQLVRDIATTKMVLQNTANPNVIVNPVQTCGGIPSTQIPNNSFGYGRVDALAAVNSVPTGSPTPTATATATAIATATRTPTPTPTATGVITATPTATATRTPTATPAACTWGAGAAMPSVGVRSVGVYFPGNGKFYAMGGRSSDTAGSDFTHPFEYDPVSNTWTTKSATYPDNQVNNMACGVLVQNNTGYIYCVGGSAAGASTATARVFRYNPVTDVIEALAAGDNWPGNSSGTILPGGFALWSDILAAANNLYILGGFDINVASTNQIWRFNQNGAVGAKWTQMVNTPMGVMYAPTCRAGGNLIYVAGASDYQGGTVVDTTNSFSFDPNTNTIGTIAPIPRATGETRALSFCNKMYVMGGGRVAPNPSNEVDIYDPATNTWSTGAPFVNPRRNFPTDTDGTNRIWLAGGYEPSAPAADMEIFNCPVSPCGASPTPTATPAASATATATATATRTPTATPTGTPSITPRPAPTPRPRPTAPPPRP